MAANLTPEQKERLIKEFTDFISSGRYDFILEVGGVVVESNEFEAPGVDGVVVGGDGEKGAADRKGRFGWMALK